MTSIPPNLPQDVTGQLAPPRVCRWRSRLHSILLAIVLLVCGAGIGAGLTLLFMVKHVQYVIHHPDVFATHATSRLRSKLDLSDEQTAKVESIFRARQEAIMKIHRQNRPLVDAELDGVEKDVAAVLNAKQAEEWRAWFEDKRRTWLPALGPPPAH